MFMFTHTPHYLYLGFMSYISRHAYIYDILHTPHIAYFDLVCEFPIAHRGAGDGAELVRGGADGDARQADADQALQGAPRRVPLPFPRGPPSASSGEHSPPPRASREPSRSLFPRPAAVSVCWRYDLPSPRGGGVLKSAPGPP